MTRFRIPLLPAALLLAAVAGAQGSHTVNLYFYKEWEYRDVSTAYGEQDSVAADTYYTEVMPEISTNLLSPGLRLLPGECFRVLMVVSDGALPDGDGDGTPDIAFKLDAQGNVVPLDADVGYAYEWFGEARAVPADEPGMPVRAEAYVNGDNTTGSRYGEVSLTYSVGNHNGKTVSLFLVTQDARLPDGSGTAWAVSGSLVSRYGVAFLTSFQDTFMLSIQPPTSVHIGRPEGTLTLSQSTKLCVGNPAPVRPTAALTSYVDESGQTIAGDELAALVTPTLQAASADAADGTLTVVPSVGLPLYRYAVETADSLGGEWELLDDWAAREGIAGTAPLGYSAIVPDGTPLVLPRKAGETSRFYRLVAPGK